MDKGCIFLSILGQLLIFAVVFIGMSIAYGIDAAWDKVVEALCVVLKWCLYILGGGVVFVIISFILHPFIKDDKPKE